tara:strand:+ start:61516 stop:62097 length:582 start_codon:yes stop_codon:yes gene_type:complete
MAKVVRKQALRVAGKTVKPTNEAETVATKKVVKKVVKKPTEEVELTAEQKAETQAEKEAKAKKDDSKAKKTKEKLANELDAIKNCGYVVGDVLRTKNGSEKEITKITSRAQGVHLWWETVSGPSAGGNYTSRVKGKVVDGKLFDAKTGKEIVEAVKPAKKKKVVAPIEAVEPEAIEVDEAEQVEEEVEQEDEV